MESHSNVEWLDIVDIAVSLKVPTISIDGIDIQMWDIVLDIVTKFKTSESLDEIHWITTQTCKQIRLEVEHIVVSDGISLRKLDLQNLRNSFTLKWSWKMSVKNTQSSMPQLASDFTDLWLEAVGLPVIKTIYKIWKDLLNKTSLTWNMSHTVPFWANLTLGWEIIWRFKTVTHKWDSYSQQGDEDKFVIWEDVYSNKPVIRTSSELSLWDTNWQQIAARQNIPISRLNRDHARDVVITVESIVNTVDLTWKRFKIATKLSKINIWPIQYVKLLSGS